MAFLKPFHGIRYNNKIAPDLSRVICPPYDVVSPSEQEEYHKLNKYNYIRIEHSRELPGDDESDNKYTRALGALGKWLEEGVLSKDPLPAIYIHDHFFELNNTEFRRRTIISTVKVEEWSKMIIRPHEGTLPKARSDREMLLRTLKANTSPVFAMFEDEDYTIGSLLENLAASDPHISANGYENDRHELRIVTEPKALQKLSDLFESRPLYIADGHHRYESALKYRREQEALQRNITGEEPFNFLMMELVSISDPGLVILPPHRLVRGIKRANLNNLTARLGELFDITVFNLETGSDWESVEEELKKPGAVRLAIYGAVHNQVHVLTVKNQEMLSKMMPAFHSELYKSLDVSIVDHIIMENLLGLTDMTDLTRISFNHNLEEVIKLIESGEHQLAIILGPAKPETIVSVADAGERMPRKSTYFHPKLPSGLVMNRLI
jgi:uncharacterized protein (DUF1015 family)